MHLVLVSQVQLLLSYAQSDTRRAIRLTALLELLSFVSEVPHTWTADMVQVSTYIVVSYYSIAVS